MHFGGRRVTLRPLIEEPLHDRTIPEGDIGGGRVHVQIVGMAEDLALAGGGEDDEFMAEIAADGAGVGAHGNGLQAHAGEGAQIGDEHLVVGMARASRVQIEGVSVLHQEFARAHHAKARAHLVAELPLDVIEIERQILVGAHIGAEDLRDHLFIGGTKEHLALVAILDAQHLLAIGLIAAALAPQISGLDDRHEQFHGARPVLLLAHDLLDLAQHPQAQRQPGVDTGGLLPHHARAQHQAVRDDFRLLGRFAERGEEESGQTHGGT